METYGVLYTYLRGNSRKNELYIAKHIDFFLTQFQCKEVGHLNSKGAHPDNTPLMGQRWANQYSVGRSGWLKVILAGGGKVGTPEKNDVPSEKMMLSHLKKMTLSYPSLISGKSSLCYLATRV